VLIEGIRRRIAFALFLLLAVATVAVAGYRLIGGPSVTLLQAIYMAVITLSGVGYTEVVDTSHNPVLRLFNIFVVLFGVAIAVYVFSVLTAFIVEGELRHLFRRGRMHKRINQLNGHFIICGLGETGRHVLEELHKTGTPFVAIEILQEVVDRLRSHSTGAYVDMLYVIGDATDEDVLQQAGLDRARGIIACLAADKDNLVITVLVRQQNPNIRIVARHKEMGFSERILKAGANSTVSPNQIGGMRMASEVLRPHVVSFLDLMLQEKSRTLRIEEVEPPIHSQWIGLTLKELQLNTKHKLLLLAMKDLNDPAQLLQINPQEDAKVAPGSILIVMGDISDLQRARAEADTLNVRT
jgi:voltage-gated potassium channel